MMYCQADHAVIAAIPKAGSQSIRMATHSNGDMPLAEARTANVRVLFLRNPEARLKSAYKFFKTIYHYGGGVSIGSPAPADVETWESFITYVSANQDNPHWVPQLECVRGFEPNCVHRFEDVDRYWPQYHSIPFPHINGSRPYDTGEISADVLANYKEDAETWLGLK